MDKFDRQMQREILQVCATTYPGPPDFLAVLLPTVEPCLNGVEERKVMANLFYLREHGLITFSDSCAIGPVSIFSGMTATGKGIDFMMNDGGLSAILNVQTIKFHRDAVVVLEDLIALSGMNDAEKEKAKSKLSELTTESLKAVVQTVTTAGLAALIK